MKAAITRATERLSSRTVELELWSFCRPAHADERFQAKARIDSGGRPAYTPALRNIPDVPFALMAAANLSAEV
jgi:hypothetical protein